MRVLFWMELRQLLRTRALMNWLLLPALLIFPILFLLIFLIDTVIFTEVTVASSGAPLPVVDAFLEEDLLLQETADPLAALAEQEVEVAVHDWIDGDGIGEARAEQPHTRWRWRVSVTSESKRVTNNVEEALEAAAEDWLESAVLAAGGELEHDLWLLRTWTLHESSAEERAGSGWVQAWLMAWVLLIALLGGVFVLSVQGIADRESGVAEQLQVAPILEGSRMLARLLAMTLVELVVIGVLLANLVLLLEAAPSLRESSHIGAQMLAGLLLINTGSLLVGELSDNVEHLMNITSAPLLLGGMGLLAAGLKWPVPWLPLAGLLQAETIADLLVAVAASLAAAALLFLVTVWLHRWQGRA